MKPLIKLIIVLCISSTYILPQNLNIVLIKTNTEKFPNLVSAIQVYDDNEDPITDLTKDNFSATLGGKEADSLNATTYKKSGLPFNIMLCVDISGTMQGKPMQAMKNAILKFIDDMRPIDKLGIIGIADDAELISDFSNNKEFLKEKVKNLSTKGNYTAVYYGAYKGLKALADNKENVGKILILIGDGKNESPSSSYSEQDVIDLGIAEGIPVFSIGYTKIDPAYLQSFEKISDKTKGKFYNSPSDDDLSRQYKKLYSQILNKYLVKYIIYNMKGDGNEYVNAVSVKYNNFVKSDNKKVVIPAGVAAIILNKETPKESTNYLLYVIIAGVVLIGAVGFVIFNKKKKEKEEQLLLQKKEEQRKQQEILEAERKKREELEKKLQESFNQQNLNEPLAQDKPINKIKPNEEKTIILSSSNSLSSGNSTICRLEFSIGAFSGQRFDIDASGATIGRKDDNSIVLKEATISGYHAKIVFNNGNFYIEDLNSSNGTYINGRQITTTILQHGDVFKLGSNEGTISVY